MRITRDSLLKAARNYVSQRARADRDLVAVYLVGSLLTDEPLLGGTADIDLVFVENHQPFQFREVVRLTTEVTLDIAYYSETDYRHPRHLRLNPWVGSSLCDTRVVLFDTQHWFEFTQSSVGSQFYTPENILARCRSLSEKARSIWLDLQSRIEPDPHTLLRYMKSVKSAVNSIACLSGAPLTERRFLLNFPERAVHIQQPGLNAGLLGLIGAAQVDSDLVKTWLPGWLDSLAALEDIAETPIRIHSARHPYYQRAVEAMLDSDQPGTALWPLMRTWTLACSLLPLESTHRSAWTEAFKHLQLDSDHFAEKLSGLDAYLDNIEETLDDWGAQNGI
jgi:predicted nucleotidyltransferase